MSPAKAVILDIVIEFLYLDTALQCLETVDKMRMGRCSLKIKERRV
jgi:hypothetical protein